MGAGPAGRDAPGEGDGAKAAGLRWSSTTTHDSGGGHRRSTISDSNNAAAIVAANLSANNNTKYTNKQNAVPHAGRRHSLNGTVGARTSIQRAIARATEDNRCADHPGSQSTVPFGRGTRNLIGVSDREHNLQDPALLVNLLGTGYTEGILCNHHT